MRYIVYDIYIGYTNGMDNTAYGMWSYIYIYIYINSAYIYNIKINPLE